MEQHAMSILILNPVSQPEERMLAHMETDYQPLFLSLDKEGLSGHLVFDLCGTETTEYASYLHQYYKAMRFIMILPSAK